MSPIPRRAALLLLALVVFPSPLLAHRLDEYLQATLVAIEPDRIQLEINLTPGIAVADYILALINRDRDDPISPNEAAAYAELVKSDLTLRLDGRIVESKLTASSFPAPADLRAGSGIIQLEFSLTPGVLPSGPHKLTLENRHLPAISVYLLNAAQPNSPSVQIVAQKRNENQSVGEIDFNYQPPATSSGH